MHVHVVPELVTASHTTPVSAYVAASARRPLPPPCTAQEALAVRLSPADTILLHPCLRILHTPHTVACFKLSAT